MSFCGGWVREGEEEEEAYPHGSHRAVAWEGVSCVRSASFWEKRAGETGGRAATLRLML